MTSKKFSDMTDKEIWFDFRIAEYRGTPLNQFLRSLTEKDVRWCCKSFEKMKQPQITLPDGTQMRVHFCPRCGREL